MISELETKMIAEGLVGEDVLPRLYVIEEGFIKTEELPVDRFAQDDDGYYLISSGKRIPTKAIIGTYYSEYDGLVLELEREYLTVRKLVR